MAKLTSDRSARLLAELMQEPGNDVCADCKSPSPRWASYNLGIFLCVHCASIHRKLGTHISKVKSSNLDQWTKDQIDSIRVTGNLNSNAMYNPNNVDPPVNLHDSERDSELEKFIRNKYQYKKLMNVRNDRDAPSSSSSRFRTAESESARNEAGRAMTRGHLAVSPPPRSSSASRPRAASPALTTKSPAPTSVSPAPPTPSPSLPTPSPAPVAQAPLQMLAPSPQPPPQMVSPSPNPPLQMLPPSAGQTMQPQINFSSGYMPGYTSPAYSGSMSSPSPYPTPLTAPPRLPSSNPVWQDMAAIQSGPAMPTFQQLMPTGVSLTLQMTSNMQMQAMPTGWAPPGGMMQGGSISSTGPSPMMMGPYTSGYSQATGMTGLQPMYTQNQPVYAMQQQVLPGQQMMYAPGTQQQQIMQPAPVQGMNQMMWMQGGGYGAPNQWQG